MSWSPWPSPPDSDHEAIRLDCATDGIRNGLIALPAKALPLTPFAWIVPAFVTPRWPSP